jgi:CO/xanthine dehydrogenase FAD-binding subunit
LGSVGPRPLLSKEAAASLQGEAPTEERFKEAARLAREEASPISDHRGADWYRSQMIEVLTQRMLESALERARQGREESR